MEELANYAIIITTYETEGDRPTLTHIFWGETKDEAFGNARAHLITDFYYSSSYEGSMPWHGGRLQLYNRGQLLNYDFNSQQEFRQIYDQLDQYAHSYNDQKYQMGIDREINNIQ